MKGRIAIVVFVTAAVSIYAYVPGGLRGGGVDGPVIHSGFSFASGGEDAEVRGVLELDGPCLYLKHPDVPDVRYPVIWPNGTKWQDDPAGVVLPGGDVALLGTAVTGGGGYHKERSRIDSVTNSEGTELALQCAEEPYPDVAIFNRGSSVEAMP